ncbi:MAG: FHA domain-containing protein [Acidobacteria bacterium]|nr:FHA domain-containing protein [Acidobacteriota bacterium]
MYVLSYQESGTPRRHALTSGDTLVGRAPACDLTIDDVSVSRHHARFSVTDRGCRITDLGSRNGTYVNGTAVTSAEVAEGDRLVLGRVPVTVESSVADHLSLSEDHAFLDSPGTIHLSIADVEAKARSADDGRSLRLLSEVARALVKSPPPNEVFTRVVQLAFDTCPAERAFLVLRDAATGTLQPRVARRRDGTDIESASVSRTIVDRVIADRVALLAADAQVDSRTAASMSVRLDQVRSFMCAPLWHEHDIIGVVYVDASRMHRFTAADLDRLTMLAHFAAIAIEQARLTARVNEEVRRRERLQRYHSPAVVSRIFEGGAEGDASFLAQERDVSVLFADLVGFTSLSETLSPAQTAALLNGFFERMAEAIFEQEGTLDKFIGDALMAVFGAPLDQPDHAVRAVLTARAMQQELVLLNERAAGGPHLRMRIGIHSGVARVGDIGSVKRREYTVLGDVVNTASRIESTVARPGQIVISRATRDRLANRLAVRPMGEVSLRGRQATIDVFEAS